MNNNQLTQDNTTVEEDIYDAVRDYRKNHPVISEIDIKAKELVLKFGKQLALDKTEGMINLAIEFDYEEEVTYHQKLKSAIETTNL